MKNYISQANGVAGAENDLSFRSHVLGGGGHHPHPEDALFTLANNHATEHYAGGVGETSFLSAANFYLDHEGEDFLGERNHIELGDEERTQRGENKFS